MGTAAVLDAKRKDERRKDLDRQLEEAKAELARLMENAPDIRDTAPAASIGNRYKGALRDHQKQRSEIAEFFDTLGDLRTWSKPTPRSSEIERMWAEYGFSPTEDSIAASKRTDYRALDRWLIEEEAQSDIQHRAPKTLRQLKAAETAVRQLVSSLLNDSKSIIGHDEMRKLRQELADLKQDCLPCYERQVDPVALKQCSSELNSSLRDIFTASHPSSFLKTIRKVCHNLLVSPQPPTIHTYNTLIMGFDGAGLHPLASTVVNAFYHSKVEPTQRTMVCLLNHFKETGQAQNFKNVIERMTGRDRRGLNIRRKMIEEVLEHGQLQKWARMKDVAIGNKYIIERARFDADLFAAIVEGMLSFDYLRHAAATLAMGIRLGLTFSARTISRLLDQCVHALDPRAAYEILQAFTARPKLVNAAFCQESDQPYLAERIQNLLDICGIQGSSPASVAPFLQDLPASILPSKEQRRGMQITRLVVRVEMSEKKLRKFERTLEYIRNCTLGQQSHVGSLDASVMQAQLVEDISGNTRRATGGSNFGRVETTGTNKGQQKMVQTTAELKKTRLLDSPSKPNAWSRFEAASRIPERRNGELAAASAF